MLSNATFVPRDISISGNFGRKFKVLLGQNLADLTSSFTTTEGKLTFGSALKGVGQIFSEKVKTGYGCLKVLEEMIDESKVVDENGIRRLLFYNPALGNSYIVKPISLKSSMSQENNMIWNYSLNLKAIASLDSIQSEAQNKKQRLALSASSFIQKQTNNVVSSLSSILF